VDDYPRSGIAPDAQFRIGEILLKQASEGNQDQANLDRAENAYRDLLLAYPSSEFAAQAKQRIATIGSRDLQSSYDIAEFYRKKEEMDSAAYYYQDVINRAPAGDLRNRATSRLGQVTR
jgi:outer membrane protein assembly factor BamD (BamD/ComL family)